MLIVRYVLTQLFNALKEIMLALKSQIETTRGKKYKNFDNEDEYKQSIASSILKKLTKITYKG